MRAFFKTWRIFDSVFLNDSGDADDDQLYSFSTFIPSNKKATANIKFSQQHLTFLHRLAKLL